MQIVTLAPNEFHMQQAQLSTGEEKKTSLEIKEKNVKEKNSESILQGTHTLRHVLESNPGGRFPLKIGSICRLVVKCKETKKKNKIQNKSFKTKSHYS